MAGAWAIAHEMQHAKFYENETRPSDLISEELACDSYAASLLFSKVESYAETTNESLVKVRDKRAMAALVGLYFIAMLSPEAEQTETHPAIRDRIELLFDCAAEGPLENFWRFAIALLWGINDSIATLPVELQDPSERDLAYFALQAVF